jgi:hypothetical protein
MIEPSTVVSVRRVKPTVFHPFVSVQLSKRIDEVELDRGSFVDPVLKLESGFVNRHDATAGA